MIVIDPGTNKIVSTWSTLPATSPHGLAIDSDSRMAFVAGHNGKLVALDLKTGKVLSTVEIAPGPDQIAYDPEAKIIYCASKNFISVVEALPSGLKTLKNIPDHAGAHSIAVDSTKHDAYIVYADDKHNFIQKFGSLK